MLPIAIASAALLGSFLISAPSGDDQEIKFADCPPAVRKALEAEAKGAKFETVTRETGDDDQTVYWAEAKLDGRLYAIGVLEDGSLSEMNLAVDDADLALDDCPAAVRRPSARVVRRKSAGGRQGHQIRRDDLRDRHRA